MNTERYTMVIIGSEMERKLAQLELKIEYIKIFTIELTKAQLELAKGNSNDLEIVKNLARKLANKLDTDLEKEIKTVNLVAMERAYGLVKYLASELRMEFEYIFGLKIAKQFEDTFINEINEPSSFF